MDRWLSSHEYLVEICNHKLKLKPDQCGFLYCMLWCQLKEAGDLLSVGPFDPGLPEKPGHEGSRNVTKLMGSTGAACLSPGSPWRTFLYSIS